MYSIVSKMLRIVIADYGTKLAENDATKYHNTQQLMVNRLWTVIDMVYLNPRERIILLAGALATDASGCGAPER